MIASSSSRALRLSFVASAPAPALEGGGCGVELRPAVTSTAALYCASTACIFPLPAGAAHRRRIALERIAIAPGRRHFRAQHVAVLQAAHELRGQHLGLRRAGIEEGAGTGARPPAQYSPWLVREAVRAYLHHGRFCPDEGLAH